MASKKILHYYNQELSYLHKQGEAFAKAHPKVASRLRMGNSHIEDPFVGRLIESFAFLTARIAHKMDNQLDQLNQALLSTLYPHYLLPIPSLAITMFTPVEDLTKPCLIKAGNKLIVDNCIFTTCYDVELLPLKVTDIQTNQNSHSLRLTLQTYPDVELNKLSFNKLRFFINLPPYQSYHFYESLFNHLQQILINDDQRQYSLKPNLIKPVGFNNQECLLPYPAHSFIGYRLLTEYFAFPEKFLFFDVTGLEDILKNGFSNEFHIQFLFNRSIAELENILDANSLILACTPMINLFEQTGEPIVLDHKNFEYQIIADAQQKPESIEVYSIKNIKPLGNSKTLCLPYFGRKFYDDISVPILYWHSQRKTLSEFGEHHIPGSEVLLNFSLNAADLPADMVLIPQLLCTNRDLPTYLAFGDDQPKISLWNQHALIKNIKCISPISSPKYRQRTAKLDHDLIRQVTINQLTFTNADETLHAIKEILSLYIYDQENHATAISQGLCAITVERCIERHPENLKYGICQGIALDLTIDETYFSDQIAYLFGCVLNVFLAQSCSINSFVRFRMRSKQRGVIQQWQPQFGCKPIL